MKLRNLLEIAGQALPSWPAETLEAPVRRLQMDSRQCQPGDVFIGLPGSRVDGGQFWLQALERGAVAALVSPDVAATVPAGRPVWGVANITPVCGALAAAFYGYPSQRLSLVGVTGTNGKTTTTHLVEFFLQHTLGATALLGTLYNRWPGHQQTALNTTPFALDLQRDLAQAVAAGCGYASMEVSSHALAQDRVAGCQFQVGVFTNLTQDHLDFHGTMAAYFQAKARLFTPDLLAGRAVINGDDPYGQQLIQRLQAAGRPLWCYSLTDTRADLRVENLAYTPQGVQGTVVTPAGRCAFRSPLVGAFNVYNLLAALGTALHLGAHLDDVVAALPDFAGVPGRMERIQVTAAQDIGVLVDYAHTPDSLENCLRATRPFVPGRLICVFGCGGDRDPTKRAPMGRIAAAEADWVVVTSDNPRTEDPARILADIVQGIPANTGALVCADRAEAIQQAITVAQPGDVVVIAGKGHEDYQILGTTKVHFDDREQARLALQARYGV
ncbi:MAG: UDP-N-acetylmuramoyl-L-alanyl-D-glutamate--2,6-diaminopimelate ligase [Gloeomargaritaceae cyanobacterium C42_A2020_066]|nr:UDP-N-acetylmuramoyl-L-alanyl-D-glutamate--2,6-diaminopimelate ligase [Gloeomargaritaceae cyanobacterium C42_A2020_066]